MNKHGGGSKKKKSPTGFLFHKRNIRKLKVAEKTIREVLSSLFTSIKKNRKVRFIRANQLQNTHAMKILYPKKKYIHVLYKWHGITCVGSSEEPIIYRLTQEPEISYCISVALLCKNVDAPTRLRKSCAAKKTRI